MARKEIFSRRSYPLQRRQVPLGENLATVVLGCALVGVIGWVWSTADRFDPALRDLPPELLAGERPEIGIYNPPLKRWEDPATVGQGAGPARVDFGLFPARIASDGWSLLGRVRQFDASNLYEKINGEAEKFLGLGFVAMHYAVLRLDRAPASGPEVIPEIAIELYDQGGIAGSTGVFAAHRSSGRKVEQRGEVTFFLTEIGVVGRFGRYFFRAAGNAPSPALQAKANALVDELGQLGRAGGRAAEAPPVNRARAMAAPTGPGARSPGDAVAPERTPPGMRVLLDALGASPADIRFKAENAFQLAFAREFWFASLPGMGPGTGPGGALGEGGEAFVHIGQTEKEAASLVAELLGEQAMEYEILTPMETPMAGTGGRGGGALLRHRFLGSYFGIRRIGANVFGAHRLNDPAQVRSIVERLAEALGRTGEAGSPRG